MADCATASAEVQDVCDLAALHDALGCAAEAAVQAWRGRRDHSLLSLLEAHAAAEDAFGRGTPAAEALDVVLAAITQAGRGARTPRPASEPTPASTREEPSR